MAPGASILYPAVVAPRAAIVATAFRPDVVNAHGPATVRAPYNAACELPYLVSGTGDPLVILYCFPRRKYPLLGYSGVWDRDRYPFFSRGGHASLDLLVARGAVRREFTPLRVSVAFRAVPPHAVVARWVEGGRHFGGDELRDLLEGVREICVVIDAVPQILSTPSPSTRRRWYALLLQPASGRVKRHALRANHAEDAPNYGHLVLVHKIAVASFVEAEAVVRARSRYHLALLGLTPLAPVHPLGDLLALPSRDNVQDVVAKLPVGRVVAPTVKGDEARPMVAELFREKLRVNAPGDAIAEEYHHRVHIPPSHHLPDPIQSRAF